MGYWQIAYGGQTQDAAAWGVTMATRERESARPGKVTLQLEGTNIDMASPFGIFQPLTITANGALWWQGVVTKLAGIADPRSESQSIEVSDPWWWLENIVFQQMWVSSVVTGTALGTITSTQGEVILSQALDGIQMNSGDVIREALIYALYSCAMLPFPTTVDESSLPALPAGLGPGGFAPFRIGTITPSVTVPFSQMRDKSCAEIIRMMLKFSPDCVTSIDMTTTPPTLNIAQRGTLPVKTIKALSAVFPTDGYSVAGFNPAPRYDLMPPVVVCKFQQTNTVDGVTGSKLTIDSYPPAPTGTNSEVWLSQPRAWVQTVDLTGGHETQQHADLKAVVRPVSPNDEAAMNWILKKANWLITGPAATSGGTPTVPFYDVSQIYVATITTAIDPDDPLNDPNKNPNNITLPDCPQLVNELISGHFPPWLQDDPNDLDCALVLISVVLKYNGGDALTAALFTLNPANPNAPTAPGQGGLALSWKVRVTNADTQTYSQITSEDSAEPVPTGFAEYLWNCMAQLFFSGTFTMTEQECTDRLPIGCTFNTVDGPAAWRSMNALVVRTEENLKTGQSRISFGPPAHLGFDALAEMFRAQLGRLPAWKLSQRTDGMYQGGSNVIGDQHAAHTHQIVIPTTAAPATTPLPFQVTVRPNPANPLLYQAKVNINSDLLLSLEPGNNMAIDGLDTWFNFIANDLISLYIVISDYTVTSAAIQSYGAGTTTFDPNLAAWDSSDQSYVFDDGSGPPNAEQIGANVMIAYSHPDSSGKPVLVQAVFNHLMMQNVVIDGRAAVYAFPATSRRYGVTS